MQAQSPFPFGPAFFGNPYPVYRQLRALGTVSQMPDGRFFVSGYAEVNAALRDRRFLVKKIWEGQEISAAGAYASIESNMMLHLDPPDHTRLRALVSQAFTPKLIANLEPAVQKITDDLIDAVFARNVNKEQKLELIEDIAYPLPIRVIAEMLGVPSEEQALFRQWSRNLVASENQIRFAASVNQVPEDLLAQSERLAREFSTYFRQLAAERRRQPHNDLISALVMAEEHDGKLSEDELIATCVLLIVAGHETTMNLIGNGLFALLRHPDQLVLLREKPDLAKNAVEELLRFDSPVQMTVRKAAEEISLGDTVIPQGAEVFLLLGAANRDPERFFQPDTLDITRKDIQPLSFGTGIHYCLGAPLSRLEGRIAFPTLLRRLPKLAFAEGVVPEELAWNENVALHGLKQLPLTY